MDLVQDPMSSSPRLSHVFAVRGVFWRRCVDWVVINVPFYFHPLLIFLSAIAFFIAARPARRTVVNHLGIIFPESSHLRNVLRAFHVFQNFAWTLTDAAVYRLLKAPFDYELEGQEFLDQLATAASGIVLTAHMGNYDLGAAVFVEKLHRQLRIIRAPEPDELAARHLDRSIEESAAGAVKVAYNTDGMALSFDLLNALRRGEIVSIQGDRALGSVSQTSVTMFQRQALLPTGPFVLALASAAPIYPVFVIRAGYRRYRVIAREPIVCVRSEGPRDAQIAAALQRWADVLSGTVRIFWPQWHVFTPVFQ
jgi:phosphatidylinositol dimannoside acyltransferase